MSAVRHFLDLEAIDSTTLRRTVDRARACKGRSGARPLAGKTLAAIFESPSTRTRVSFEIAMRELGGETISLMPGDMQLGRGETVQDTARVLSRYVDAIMMRTVDADLLAELARSATVPVINGLTGKSHPCQLMADVMTFEEHRGPIAGKSVAWSGDGNNVACTWIEAAARFAFELRLACPERLRPPDDRLAWARDNGATIVETRDPDEAVAGADCVVTDTWTSMGNEPEDRRRNLLAPYRIDDRLMALAKPDAVFMHCLPAHRGEEVSASVLDGPQSIVWDEAENRLHAQKGILAWCMG